MENVIDAGIRHFLCVEELWSVERHEAQIAFYVGNLYPPLFEIPTS